MSPLTQSSKAGESNSWKQKSGECPCCLGGGLTRKGHEELLRGFDSVLLLDLCAGYMGEFTL